MPRRLFIGDIHGHYRGLLNLWEEIAPIEGDEVYCVGDLIDRGPDSAEVVEFVRQHATACVQGNHEQLMLEAFAQENVNLPGLHNWLHSGGHTTVASYENRAETFAEHRAWIASLPLYLDLGSIWLVHAGLNPALPVEDQNSHELCWIRDSFHSTKQPYFTDKTIIAGHTITFTFPGIEPGQIVQGRGWLDIDTGVYHPRSGWLTALDWGSRQVYQVNVFTKKRRKRSFESAITTIDPALVKSRGRDGRSRVSGKSPS